MKKRKLAITSIIIFLFTAIIIFYVNDNNQLSGNDKDAIEKYITSINGFEDKTIQILEIKDLDELRIVAFLSNNEPGFMQFTKNKDGNYSKDLIEVKNNETLGSFSPTLPLLLFVTNNQNEIANMEVTINGVRYEQKFAPNETTVTWMELPEVDKDKYIFSDYKYFDKDGTLIKEFK